ncbi:hypothetical protein [Actinacidiphila acidipaludis]|uniref:Uncharacterized protein n=1 Tax=Actinacidiphila acidipaludis TaxID=2873382 RepID=A0ABS7PZ94_9ACTN|nr:hypothetical protein [Streptomyces acidipaludis]MBY8876048.1 hypothetical protein [Streptomyces acidipaludis]
MLRHGQSFDPELDDQGCVLYPGGQEPMELGLLFRPYAFMEAGDEVADADGATWRFAHPWSWRSPQGQSGVPVWPLALRTRGGRRVEGEPVVSATVGGSHEGEEDTWRGLTGAEPVAP